MGGKSSCNQDRECAMYLMENIRLNGKRRARYERICGVKLAELKRRSGRKGNWRSIEKQFRHGKLQRAVAVVLILYLYERALCTTSMKRRVRRLTQVFIMSGMLQDKYAYFCMVKIFFMKRRRFPQLMEMGLTRMTINSRWFSVLDDDTVVPRDIPEKNEPFVRDDTSVPCQFARMVVWVKMWSFETIALVDRNE